MQQCSIEGGVFGSRKNAILNEQRKHRGLNYFYHRLFISSNALKETYPVLKKHPILLPVYQIRRWPVALFTKRAEIRNEIREVRATEEKEIKSYDELMKKVGL